MSLPMSKWDVLKAVIRIAEADEGPQAAITELNDQEVKIGDELVEDIYSDIVDLIEKIELECPSQ